MQTDQPIIGVLTQPLNSLLYEEANSYDDENMVDSYIPASHVRYLEQAGARVVPISYRFKYETLTEHLRQVNGIYIPGESPILLNNEKYKSTVSNILDFVSK